MLAFEDLVLCLSAGIPCFVFRKLGNTRTSNISTPEMCVLLAVKVSAACWCVFSIRFLSIKCNNGKKRRSVAALGHSFYHRTLIFRASNHAAASKGKIMRNGQNSVTASHGRNEKFTKRSAYRRSNLSCFWQLIEIS